jgi:hypothetical protein
MSFASRCGLEVGGVNGDRGDQLGRCNALLAAPFAVHNHGVEDAVRAAGGDGAGLLVHAVDLADLVTVEHPSNHSEDFGLELGAAGAQVALQQVDEGVQAEDLVQEGVVFHAPVVHGTGTLPSKPLRVFLLRHVVSSLRPLPHPALLRQPVMDLEELVVRMHVPEEIKGFLFVRHMFLVFAVRWMTAAAERPQFLLSACITGRIFSRASDQRSNSLS